MTELELRDRIEVLETMRNAHQVFYDAALRVMQRAIELTGGEEAATSLVPSAFERVAMEERDIRRIDDRLEELHEQLLAMRP